MAPGAERSGRGALTVGRFFDPAGGGALQVELRSEDGTFFALLRPIAYAANEYAEPFVVPAHLRTFRTDFATVPWVFAWLVPRSGRFLPAAILHDALVPPGDYEGPDVTRAQADHIFREAMLALGTGRIRAWLMWSAVTMGTMWTSGRLYWRTVLVGLLAVTTLLGIVATLDLLDVWNVLPWMGQRPFGVELATGAVAAVAIPAALALTWRKFVAAGVITAVALAFLVHVTIVIAALYSLYWIAERVVSGRGPPYGR